MAWCNATRRTHEISIRVQRHIPDALLMKASSLVDFNPWSLPRCWWVSQDVSTALSLCITTSLFDCLTFWLILTLMEFMSGVHSQKRPDTWTCPSPMSPHRRGWFSGRYLSWKERKGEITSSKTCCSMTEGLRQKGAPQPARHLSNLVGWVLQCFFTASILCLRF